MRFAIVIILALSVLVILYMIKQPKRELTHPVIPYQESTITDQLDELGPAARSRLRERFAERGTEYPPAEVILTAFKNERRLEVYARDAGSDEIRLIHSYPILGASGTLGPKLREGDRQVPEGLYRLTAFNPNSRFHLSLRINYPNSFDLDQARKEGRTEPGSDIMIHGSDQSIGCLAIGDPAIEEVFTLAADVGLENIELLIAPFDYRTANPAPTFEAPEWMASVYANLSSRIEQLPIQ